MAAEGSEPTPAQLVVLGEKGRSQLQRDMRDRILATVAGGCSQGLGWAGLVLEGRGGARRPSRGCVPHPCCGQRQPVTASQPANAVGQRCASHFG